MRLAFDRPAWLLLALAAPFAFAFLRTSLADFPRRQLALQATLRALVIGGLALALAGPTLRRPAHAVSAVALVDVSDSVSDGGLAAAQTAVDALARAAASRGDPPPRLVRFAARAEEVAPASPAGVSRFSPPAGAATDLALAVGLGAGLANSAALPRLLLLSDGRPTRGDLAGAADRLAARGVRLYALPLPPPPAGDAAVVALVAPDDVRPRVPFPLDIRVLSDRPTTLRIHLDGDRHTVIDEPDRVLPVAAGLTTITATARVTEPGVAHVHARIAAPGDLHPQNDEGVLAIATEREPRALCLEGAPGAAAAFARALAAEHITADVRPARAGLRDADLTHIDLVVLADVPRAQLPDTAVAALDGFVRQGGGLLVGGGTQSFGPGGYTATRFEKLLPVRLDVPDRREEASLALALVIDKSGSMAGAKMDLTKDAARATAETLPPADQIAVIVFDAAANPVVRLQRAANRQRILADISRIQASGGTNILAGLREAVDELVPARARKKHVILLSDGQSPYEEIPDLVDAATAARITVSAVGVGDGADQTLLKNIATRGGGRFYHTRDPASIPRIFSRETAELGDQSIVERPTGIRVAKRVAALAGVPLDATPPLGGYVVTQPRPEAETILATADGAPLLARWPLGLGQVVAWTSDLGARWSASWTRWPPGAKLWSQIARAAMRRRAASHFPIQASRAGDLVQLTVDAIGPDDRFMTGLDATVEVTAFAAASTVSPSGPRTLQMREIAPGRYEASLRPDVDAGALLFQATLRAGGYPVADATGRLALPFALELRPPVSGPDEPSDGLALLTVAATRTGGRIVHDPAEILDPGLDLRETRQPLRVPVLLVTALLFVLDVAARRVRLRGA